MYIQATGPEPNSKAKTKVNMKTTLITVQLHRREIPRPNMATHSTAFEASINVRLPYQLSMATPMTAKKRLTEPKRVLTWTAVIFKQVRMVPE
jgi:hypothetical protein